MAVTVRLQNPLPDTDALNMGLTDLPYRIGRVVTVSDRDGYGLIDAGWAVLVDFDTGDGVSNPDGYATRTEVAGLVRQIIAGMPVLLPAGGTTSQVLVKASDADYDTRWVTATGTGTGGDGGGGGGAAAGTVTLAGTGALTFVGARAAARGYGPTYPTAYLPVAPA